MNLTEKYNSHHRAERVYSLPMRPLSDTESPLLRFVGSDAESERSWQKVQLSLDKAESGQYQRILFPQNILMLSHGLDSLREALGRGFLVSIWVTPQYFLRLKLKMIQALLEMGVDFEILVVAGEENSLDSVFQRMGDRKLAITFLMTKNLSAEASFQKLGNSQHEFYFYFPTPQERESQLHSVRQIKERVGQFRKRYGDLTIQGRSGLDIYDPRIKEDQDLEPMIPPSFESSVLNRDVKISVIIPSHNNSLYLSVVVKHLTRQDLSSRLFEIVLVDDGSDDGTFEYFRDFVQTHRDQFNLKLIHFPRERSGQMGERPFRASVARNLGVKNSVGEIYVFLDPDILVPSNYLSNLLQLHRSWDVVQGRRLELLKQKSHSQTLYDHLDPESSTYRVESGFGVGFSQDSSLWNDIEDGWQHLSTHSLSVKAELFKGVGWFRKTFFSYGYEGSELGYRLWKSGARFSLNDQYVYHLYHADSRSESGGSQTPKRTSLLEGASVFYVNSLSEEVYNRLNDLFDDFFHLKSLFIPVVDPAKSLVANLIRALSTTLWFLSFLIRRISGAFFAILLSPWALFSRQRLQKRFCQEQQRGVRGVVGERENWRGRSKPLSLVRYYHCGRDDDSEGDFLQSVMKAANGHFDGIVFSESLLLEEKYEQVLEFARSKLPRVIVEVSQDGLFDVSARLRIEAVACRHTIHLVVDRYEDKIIPEIHRLLSFNETLLILSLSSRFVIDGFLRALGEEFWPQVHLRARPTAEISNDLLSSDELFNTLRQAERRSPGFIAQPELGMPITNLYGWKPNFEGFSIYDVGLSRVPQIKLSVVVHHRLEYLGLESLVRHLKAQEVSPDLFEVIWVCDGIEEDQAAKELAHFMTHCSVFNFRMLRLPPGSDQATDEWTDRSDLALYLGAGEARGEIISFICSDMVWQKNTISDLIEKHKSYDVIQSQIYLAPRQEAHEMVERWSPSQLKQIEFASLLNPQDYRVKERELATPWSMLGRYGFSIKREAYFWVGGVRKEYFGTGLAISELGYRISEAGTLFYLNSRLFAQYYIGSLNQFYPKSRFPSFYGARMFFSETLSSEVYQKFLGIGSFFRLSRRKSLSLEVMELPLKWLGFLTSILISTPDDIVTSWRLSSIRFSPLKWGWLEKVYDKICNPHHFNMSSFSRRVGEVVPRLFSPLAQLASKKVPQKIWWTLCSFSTRIARGWAKFHSSVIRQAEKRFKQKHDRERVIGHD
ncbi:glycosyltransferase [Bdellovibrionales bacterium]|nr:glycosyltransferase [Bdellovibrionales bacterium]